LPKLHINDCITADHAPKNIITLLVALSGLAALSWQVLWQLKASLALGVSAWGTAVTLAVTMGGMCIGALITGCILERIKSIKPLRLYGAIECAVGLAGLSLNASFAYIERLDIAVYQTAPDMAPAFYLLGITLSLGIQTLCLGATVPVIGLMARQTKIPIATLYGMNTLGAAVGALLSAFLFIPALGLLHTIWLNSAINLTVGLIAIVMGGKSFAADPYTNPKPAQYLELSFPKAMIVVFATGAATFMLEVAWFRSLTAAFMSTTDAFAIMLACVLVSLGLGARLVPFISTRRNVSLPALLGWAGIAILLATPLIERFDLYVKLIAHYEIIIFVQWFFLTLYVIGLPVLLLGLSLPWVLDAQERPWKWGALYGLNSFAAILGALSAGWILLPNLGLARTAWIAGLLVGAVGIALTKKESRINLTALVAISLGLTFFFRIGFRPNKGSGRLRF
jgi:spermidine synthase